MASTAGCAGPSTLWQAQGRLRLRNGTTAIGADSAPIATGTLYRIGLHQKTGTGSDAILEGYVATGDAAFGAAFASTTSGTWTTQADRLQFGTTTSVALDGLFDNVRLDVGSMPPAGATPGGVVLARLPFAPRVLADYALARPAPTSTSTATATPGATPTPTATPTQTNTATASAPSTATATPTATATSGGPTTLTAQVAASSNDANQDGSALDTTSATIWLGNAAPTTSSYTGLRFTVLNVPHGATITSAHLEVYSSQQ